MASNTKEIDFDNCFKIILTALKTNGAHPSTTRNKKWLIQFLIMHGLCTAVWIIMAYNIYLNIKLKDYSEACRNASLSVVYCNITFQYFILVFKQKTIVRIIDTMKADYAKDMPEDARQIVFEYAMKGKKVCVKWMTVTTFTFIMFIAKHIFLELYTYYIDDWKLLQLYPLTYPAPVEEHKGHPAVYTFLYMMSLYFILYGSIMYTGFVPLGPIFMLHAVGQLEIVKKRALSLYEGKSTGEVEVAVKEIVKQLQNIYSFVECIKEVFILIYEATLKSATILLPVTVYEVIESFRRGEFEFDFINIIIGGTIISSAPCYFSDKLMEKGEEVRLAIYSCGWETRYDRGVRKILVLILLRTLQPIAVRTLFRTVCLDALTDIYQQAYTIFNLMNAAWG